MRLVVIALIFMITISLINGFSYFEQKEIKHLKKIEPTTIRYHYSIIELKFNDSFDNNIFNDVINTIIKLILIIILCDKIAKLIFS